MCDKSIEFSLHDKPNAERLGNSSLATQYAEIQDLNGGNYQSGLITFSNVNLQNAMAGSVFDLSEALYHIPMTWKATIANGTFTSDGTNIYPPNKFAVTKKANHHFFHNSWCKLGNVPLEKNNSGYNNFYINEKKKRKSTIDSITDDVDSIYFDNADSYAYTFNNINKIGEYNNYSEYENVYDQNENITGYNNAIFKRNGHFIDITSNSAQSLLPGGDVTGRASELSQLWQPYFTNTPTTLTWNDVLVGKISDINSVFGDMPPVFHLNGFEIRLQMNAGGAFSTTVNYLSIGTGNTDLDGNDFYDPVSITSNLGNGQTCPLLLSSASNTGKAGLTFLQTAGNAVTITITCTIGWGNANPAPCRLLIPYHRLDGDTLEKFKSKPYYTFFSNNFYLDNTVVGIPGGQLVQKTLATHYNRPRKLYIIPFLSNQNKTANGSLMLSPFQSPLSSAPNTCSLCKLKNFNILLGGASIFSQQALYTPHHFYDENYRYLNALDYSYGNSQANPLKSGRITKSDFIKGPYNSYIVDLESFVEDADDEVAKSLGIQWIKLSVVRLLYNC